MCIANRKWSKCMIGSILSKLITTELKSNFLYHFKHFFNFYSLLVQGIPVKLIVVRYVIPIILNVAYEEIAHLSSIRINNLHENKPTRQ
jgi:hypothetical protein